MRKRTSTRINRPRREQLTLRNVLDQFAPKDLQEFVDALPYGYLCGVVGQATKDRLKELKDARPTGVAFGERPPFLRDRSLYDELNSQFQNCAGVQLDDKRLDLPGSKCDSNMTYVLRKFGETIRDTLVKAKKDDDWIAVIAVLERVVEISAMGATIVSDVLRFVDGIDYLKLVVRKDSPIFQIVQSSDRSAWNAARRGLTAGGS